MKRAIFASAGVLALLVGAVGLLHLPVGRPVLGWIAAAAGCPVSFGDADPVALEAHRIASARGRRGSVEAKARPAFGFDLGTDRRAEVEAILSGRGAECDSQSGGAVLRCTVPDNGAPATPFDAHVQFDPAGRLVAVDVWHSPQPSARSLAAFERVNGRLVETVGGPTTSSAPKTAEELSAKTFRRVASEYHYANYLARISVTNLGKHGIRVREQYQWLPSES